MASIADILFSFKGDDKQLQLDAAAAGQKAGETLGQRLGTGTKAGLAAVGGVVAAGLGVALKGALELTDVTAKYRAETGATADEAKQAQGVITDLYKTGTDGFSALGDALTIVHNDLHQVGDEAKATLEVARAFARATGQELVPATQELAGLTKAYNLDAAGQKAILDQLVASHQRYGGSITDEIATLQALAPALTAAKLSWTDGIGILNLFTKAGVDASTAPVALAKALAKVHSPEELQKLIADIGATQDPFLRAQKAADLFGAKAGPKLAAALAGSSGQLSDYVVAQDQAAGATEQAAAAIESTPLERFKIAMHALVTGPLAEFGSSFTPILGGLGTLGTALGSVRAGILVLGAENIKETASAIASTIATNARAAAYLLLHPQFLLTAIQLGVLTAAEGIYSVATGIATAVTSALGVAMDLLLGPIGLIILAVGALFVAWNANFLGIRDLVGGVVDWLVHTFGFLLGPIQAVGDAIGKVLGFVHDVVTGIHDFLFGAETAVDQSATRMQGRVGRFGRDVGPTLATNLGNGSDLVGKAADDVFTVPLTDALDRTKTYVTQVAPTIPAAAADGIKGGAALVQFAINFVTGTIGYRLVAMGPEARAKAASISLGIAQGIRDKRTAIDQAISQLATDEKNRLTPMREIGHDVGLLFGKSLAKGLHDADPVVKKQAEGTRALIEDRLIELVQAGGKAGQKIQEELQQRLHSKDPDVRAQAQRTKSIIDAALKAQPARTPGDVIGAQLNTDLGNHGTELGHTAYQLGRTIAKNLIAGVKGSGPVAPTPPAPPGGAPRPQYQHGTDYVPADMLAYLHRGEIVIPAAQAERIRAGAASPAGLSGPLIGELHVDARGHDRPEQVGFAVRRAVGDAIADVLREQTSRLPVGTRA